MSVLDLLPELHRAGATDGGEYGGPCPWCGGTDRFRVWPFHSSGKPRYWCRRCTRAGDSIDLLRELKGLSYSDAAAAAGQRAGERAAPRRRRQDALACPPSATWQSRAEGVAQAAEAMLWKHEGTRALAYLRERGFAEETLRAARLGYLAKDCTEKAGAWGLDTDHRPVWTPRGISIPWRLCGALWRLNIRRAVGKPKYIGPAGASNGLYGADGIDSDRPVVIVEGELDALAIAQEAGDLATAAATGSTHGARHSTWLRLLKGAPAALVAYDADDAGEEAAAWWLSVLPGARRLLPDGDPAAMLQKGADVRGWIEDALDE